MKRSVRSDQRARLGGGERGRGARASRATRCEPASTRLLRLEAASPRGAACCCRRPSAGQRQGGVTPPWLHQPPHNPRLSPKTLPPGLTELRSRAESLTTWKLALSKGVLPAAEEVDWPVEPFKSKFIVGSGPRGARAHAQRARGGARPGPRLRVRARAALGGLSRRGSAGGHGQAAVGRGSGGCGARISCRAIPPRRMVMMTPGPVPAPAS